MKRTIIAIICGAAVCAGVIPAAAVAAKNPDKAGRIQKQKVKQELRQLVGNGQVTPEQAQALRAKMKALRAEIKAAKKDGKASPAERNRLKAERQQLREELQSLAPKSPPQN